jgi:hypothetical protein
MKLFVLDGSQNKQRLFPHALTDLLLYSGWTVFTARYKLTLSYRLAFGALSGIKIANCGSHRTDTKTTDEKMIACNRVNFV